MAVAQTDRDAQVAPAPRTSSSADRSPWPRRIAWALGILVVLAVGTQLTAGYPEGLVIGVEDWFSDVDSWVIENQRTFWLFTSVLNPLQDAITSVVEGLNAVFERMTWLGLVVGAGMLAGIAAGWRLGLLASAGVATFGVLGVWERSLQTLSLMTISVLVALAIGIPLGILAGRRPGVDRVLRPILDGMQTIPAYSYLLPFVLFLGTGYPPALAATVVFAVPPAVRLTSLGIRSVPTTTMEVAESFGTTSRQTLRKVQIPIARPSMMLGVNQTIMMALGMVVIAAVVGAEGLGREVLDALKGLRVGDALNAGIAIVVMAIVLDRVTTAWSQRDRTRAWSFSVGGRDVSRRVTLGLAIAATIMMALGMVVIAAVVGAEGLGREVLDALKGLRVGDALNAGIAIVVMAIVLDRVTTAWSQRDRTRAWSFSVGGRDVSRRVTLGLAIAATIVAIVIGREVLRQQEWPEAWTFSVAAPTDAIVEWSQENLVGLTSAIGDFLEDRILDPFADLLVAEPWWVIAGLAALAGWKAKGARLAVFSFACVFGLGALGMWELSMETLSLVLVAVAIALVFAIPIGIVAARSDRFDRAIRPVLDAMQTMPAFVYLVPVLLLFAPGPVPAVIASVVYALPVGIRLTNLGIRHVPTSIVEAADAFGTTPTQKLRKVQLPLARPSILLGVNQTIMMVLSVVIIGGMIGAGGLGFEALVALSKTLVGRGVVVGLSILLLAVMLDRLTQALGSAPRSMRGPVGLGGFVRWPRLRAIGVRTTEGPDPEQGQGEGEG